MTGRVLRPFKVTRDGTVTHREAGHVIGWVRLTDLGWRAYDVEQKLITTPHWNGRKYAAACVWDAYQRRAEEGRT